MADDGYISTTPTLLIGLGGLGSSIVQSVFSGLPERYREYTRAHVMDTDVKEFKDARYAALLNERWVTQTSPNLTVMECVERLGNASDVRQWFPPVGFGALGHKLMPSGAAQVRAISRLAMLDTINSRRIQGLNAALDHLTRKRGTELDEPVRVNIVNSVAGGTGSGSFLQVALYVRAYLEEAGVSHATVAAFVVMPDVFVRAGDYGAELEANVKANGYASLKEIDAFVRLRAEAFAQTGNEHLAPLYPVAIEYKPRSTQAHPVVHGKPPLDVITVFDFSGEDGSNLGSKFQTIRQVEDALRLHLFSPLEGRAGITSQTDNLVNTHLKQGDRSRYAGCGTAHVEYPVDDMVRYAALRWATDGISSEWLSLDKLIKDEIRRVEEARREGNFLEMPDPHTRYGELMRDKAEVPRPPPFYRSIYDDAHLLNEKGERVAPKHQLWLEAVDKLIRATVASAVSEKSKLLSQIDETALQDPANTVSQVQASEDGLALFAKEVEKRVQAIGAAAAKQIMWQPFDDNLPCNAADESQLNTWVLARSAAMHPMAMRYLLGEARVVLKDRLAAYKAELTKVSRAIDGYAASWDLPETEHIVETATDRAAAAAKKRFARLLGTIKDFAEDYLAKSRAQETRIRRRAELVALSDCTDVLLGYVEDMADVWRNWFLQLETVRLNNRAEIERLEVQHEQAADRTRIFVHASRELKQLLWEDERANLAAVTFPPDISQEMYLALYREKGRQYRQSMPPHAGADWVERLFRSTVVDWCEKVLRKSPAFDMDVSTALRSELRLLKRAGMAAQDDQDEDTLVRYLNQLDKLAIPWVQAGGKGQPFEFWGIHPEACASWGEKVLDQRLSRRIENEGFSRYRLSKMRLLYALCASDLLSMTGDHSSYRAAYLARIAAARSIPPKSTSPHVDFRWDSPACLPEIDDAEQAQAMHDLHVAALLNLAHLKAGVSARVYPLKHDTRMLWHWSPHGGQQVPAPGILGQAVPATCYGLVEVLAMNHGWVRPMVSAERQRQQDQRTQPDLAPLITQLPALLDELAEVPAQAPDQVAGNARQSRLVHALVTEVLAIQTLAIGTPNAARQAARAAMTKAMAQSAKLQADPGSTYASLVKRTVDALLSDVGP